MTSQTQAQRVKSSYIMHKQPGIIAIYALLTLILSELTKNLWLSATLMVIGMVLLAFAIGRLILERLGL